MYLWFWWSHPTVSKVRRAGPRWHYAEHRHLRASWGGAGTWRRLRGTSREVDWNPGKSRSQEPGVGNAVLPERGGGQRSWMLQTWRSAKMSTEKCIGTCVSLSVCTHLHMCKAPCVFVCAYPRTIFWMPTAVRQHAMCCAIDKDQQGRFPAHGHFIITQERWDLYMLP